MRRLLFLNGIKAFEAAARSGSFAAAGAELNVSAAAVSRMVHLLEERLGVALFERKANRLATTAAGRAYQSGLTPIFDALASLTAQVTAPSSVRVLTIGVGPTFAMRWLIPRLADFRKQEPDIDVRITTGGAAVPFGDDWSCGIKLGDGEWPGLIAEPLFAADLLPVCAPRLASAAQTPRRSEGTDPAARGAFARRLAVMARRPPASPASRARGPEFAILRPGAAGRGRRPRHRHGHPALYRRRPRRRPAGRAVCVERAERHALVSGLSRLPHRAARFRRVPALDCPRRGGARHTPQGASDMPDEQIETLVIGGGQAGLVMSHRLKQRGLSHLVLERHRIAERWRSERWDGLKFQFPNWSVRLPDFPFPHSDPDALCDQRRHRRIHRGLCRFRQPRRSAAASR